MLICVTSRLLCTVSGRARQLALNVPAPKVFNKLQQQFAERSWGFWDIFPLSAPHPDYHREVVATAAVLDASKPLIIGLLGANVTYAFEHGLVNVPNFPEIHVLFKDFTDENCENVFSSAEIAAWVKEHFEGRKWDDCYDAGFTEKIGHMFIVELFGGLLIIAIIKGHTGAGKYDPGLLKARERLALLIELKVLILRAKCAKIEERTEDALLQAMNDTQAESVRCGLEQAIRYCKDEIYRFTKTVQRLRATDALIRKEKLAEERGELAIFRERRSQALIQGIQNLNARRPHALGAPGSDKRKAFVDGIMKLVDIVDRRGGIPPIPQLIHDRAELIEHLNELPEDTNITQHFNGMKGQIVLQQRSLTDEGRKAIEQQYAKGTQTRRDNRRSEDDIPLFSDGCWSKVKTAEQAVLTKLANPEFDAPKPQETIPWVAECVLCGDTPVVTKNSTHNCPKATPPSGNASVASLKTIRRARVLTPFEILSSRRHFQVPSTKVLEAAGLVMEPASEHVPPSVKLPEMDAECEARWRGAFVIYRPGQVQAAQYQALDILIYVSRAYDRDEDWIYADSHDGSIHRDLAPVFVQDYKPGNPVLRIWTVVCNHGCPQTQIALSTRTKGRDIFTPNQWYHQKQKFRPNQIPSWLVDEARVKRMSDSLDAHVKGSHGGKPGREYLSFWELPQMVKRAYLRACYFSNSTMAPELRGRADTLLNRRVPE
ncbi:hypothetical protein DL93DRAFT_1421599 [Clavulina sp. PMI_390]|nr:hypothetical protein DL93DRAFT_1421599 [Clavulina sp. PMI_390]